MIICNAINFSIENLYCLYKYGTTFLCLIRFITCMNYFTEHLQLYCKIHNYTKNILQSSLMIFKINLACLVRYLNLLFQETSKVDKYIFNNPLLFLLPFSYVHSHPNLLNLQHYISSQASTPTASSNIYRADKGIARIYITISHLEIYSLRKFSLEIIYCNRFFLPFDIIFFLTQKIELSYRIHCISTCDSSLRVGSRRPSLASVHSSTSSSRSFSARRLEKERNDKEQRQALQELRLAKQREQLQQQQQQVVPTPSPRTPHSTDELLPSVEEGKEVFYNEVQKSVYISLEMPVISMSIGLFNDDS